NDGQTQSFSWNISDASGLSRYEIVVTQGTTERYRETATPGSSDATAVTGSFNFDSYGLGTFVLTITATDNDNDWDGDRTSQTLTRTVTVTDDDTAAPVILTSDDASAPAAATD